MKAEELFVGALVRVNRDGLCIKKDTIVEVRAVDADDKLIEKGLVGSARCRPLDDNQFDGGIWCEYLDPLPLTPEILEKNGFYLNGIDKRNTMSINIEYGKWSYENEDGFDVVGDGHDIKFVHQLQHALRLCRIEKEIEL